MSLRNPFDIHHVTARPAIDGLYLVVVNQGGVSAIRSAYWGVTPEYPVRQWLTSADFDALPLEISGWAYPTKPTA